MNVPNPRPLSPAAQPYKVFAVPVGENQEEQFLKSFELAFEAKAFARLLSEGGRYVRVRVESPPGGGQQESGRAVVSAEVLQAPPRPGCLFQLLYAGSLFLGAFLALAAGFVGIVLVKMWLLLQWNLVLPGKWYYLIFLALAAAPTVLVVKIHAAVFRERGPKRPRKEPEASTMDEKSLCYLCGKKLEAEELVTRVCRACRT